MLKSMTAYGRALLETPLGRFTVEVQSVNRKFLEINTFLPVEFLRFDIELKKLMAESASRGQINCKLNVSFESTTPITVKPNLPLVKQIKHAWDQIANEIGSKEEFHLALLAAEKNILIYADEFKNEEDYRSALREVFSNALKSFSAMKKQEGESLQKDIEARVDLMQKAIDRIALKAPDGALKYRQKLIDKLKDFLPESPLDEERLLREICLFADKGDIAEEITRFNSHLKQFRELLRSDAAAIGKTLEFLLQELNRETNTIGSKASDVDVTKLVVEIKSELERIREQIQNVE